MNKFDRIADQAVEGLRDATGLKVLWENTATTGLDGFVVIDTGNNTIRLPTQIRQRAMAHHVDELRQLGKPNTLLLAEQIPDSLKQTLRQTQQNYLDGAGNCYIHVGSMLLIVQGRKLAPAPAVAKQPFGKSGLRVLFSLLILPDAINLSVRELAEQAGVSVGTAQHTIDYLKKSGYVISVDNKRKKLIKLDKLREQWAGRYAAALKPSLIMGCFRLPKNLSPADWRQVALQPGTYWSGEPAADALTNELRPATLTLYTNEDKAGLLKTYKLLPDPDGPVEVNQVFWKDFADTSNVPTVPPLLAYADLLSIDDPRTTDIARRIYQDHIANA
ncbi:type IV toxin-antitoxin system AbiEi family antitoxin [Rudanella lutea]|uniref:type IV toxin-antitoxin system AbiEi family antitoxin n=1 Tax=Rudanella lutea TaxID=451374 RepID=UPI001FE1ED43|nr:type IV toxin-antitoxin system AbiEi family antitoxin [Rudanella lutea]